MRRITLAGLLKIELPGHTVLLCDGGTLTFDGDTYYSRDALFGVIAGADEINEGVGDEAPAFSVSFLPDPDAAAAELVDPAYQGCRLRMWIAEVDEDTGLITGEPSAEVDAIIDVPTLTFPDTGRVLKLECVSVWQRLFDYNEGNFLNGPAHKRVYPAETGADNATGVTNSVAWGANSVRGVR